MNDLREALYGQFPTRKLVFTTLPIARECSIRPDIQVHLNKLECHGKVNLFQ